MTTETLPALDKQTAVRKRLITVAEYYKMAEVGIFHNDSRIELIEGELIEMAAAYAPRVSTVMRITELFSDLFAKQANLSIQCPLCLDNYAEVEPDVAVLRRRDDFYADAKPAAKDARLVVEVADSSLIYDRRIKPPLYAKRGVPECWIVNLQDKIIGASRQPLETGYRQTTIYQPDDAICRDAFPNVLFSVSEILGERKK